MTTNFKLKPISAALFFFFASQSMAYVGPDEVVYDYTFSANEGSILGAVIGGNTNQGSSISLHVHENGSITHATIGSNDSNTGSVVRISENGFISESKLENTSIYISDDSRYPVTAPERRNGGLLINSELNNSVVSVYENGETRNITINANSYILTYEGAMDNNTSVKTGGNLYTMGGGIKWSHYS